MTTYNTGNPIGSPDPRDLYDNAQVVDEYANSDSATTSDRLGNSRKTLSGMNAEYEADKEARDSEFDADQQSRFDEFDADQDERKQRFDTFIASSGYQFVGDYDAGIELTEYNQVVRDTNGEFWRVSGSQSLPYTTTGAGLPEGGAFVTVGDAALRQELDGDVANGQGARLVRGAVIYVDTVADLQALDTSGLVEGATAFAGGERFVFRDGRWQSTTHPFAKPSPQVRPVDAQPRIYRGLKVNQFVLSDESSIFAWREAPGHGNENPGTRIVSARTLDHGYTWTKGIGPGNSGPITTTVYTQSNVDVRSNISAVMDNGRLGILAARVLPDNSHQTPVFIYSDDNGVTWQSTTLSGNAANWNFHGKIIRYPSSVGGSDDGGWIGFFYKASGAGGGVFYTLDNGETWTEVEDVVTAAGSTYPSVTELSVTRIGDTDRWIMGIRSGGTGSNLAISVSDDLLNWSTMQDSGLPNDRNPPELFYDGGKIWALGFSRDGRTPLVYGYRNAVVVSGADADTLYESEGAQGFEPYQVISSLPFWPTGYGSLAEVSGRYYYLFNVENYGGSTQSDTGTLMMLSSDCAIPVTPVAPQPNLLINGTLRQWPLGNVITAGASGGVERKPVIPGMTFCRGSAVGNWTISRITGNRAPYAMRIERDDGTTQEQPMIAVFTLPLLTSRPLAGKQLAASFRARRRAGFSSENSFLSVRLIYSGHASEQAIDGRSGVFNTDSNNVGTSTSGVTLTNQWQRFVLVPSRNTANAWQFALRIAWDPQGTALNDGMEIEEVKLEAWDNATPFEYSDLFDEQNKCERFVQVFTVVLPANQLVFMPYPGGKMHAVPSVALDNGDVSVSGSPNRDGLRLNNATGSTQTVTVTAKTFL